MSELSSIGDLDGTFVYDVASGPLLPVSAAVCGYDAMPEPVRLYNTPLATCAPSLQCSSTGSYAAHLPASPGGWGSSNQLDSETGLDYFGARYFSGAQGRFTSPDDPLTFADPENPQTWNLYGYGLNNPLLYSDPSGHNPCVNGVNPETGNMCATGTAQAPVLNPLQEMMLRSVLNTMGTIAHVAQKTQDVLQPAIDWAFTPHDPGCMERRCSLAVAPGREQVHSWGWQAVVLQT